jgi:AmpD protein
MTEKADSAPPFGLLGTEGWLANCEHIASPNHDARPADTLIRLVVVHAISLPPGQFGGDAVVDLFLKRLDPAAHPYFVAIAGHRVSAHFFIRRNGHLIQFVSCGQRAWHAGISCWRGNQRCNDFSIGIELEGDDYSSFEPQQYRTLDALLAILQHRFPIEAIVGHADIAPGRKTDPGPYFEWRRETTPRALD